MIRLCFPFIPEVSSLWHLYGYTGPDPVVVITILSTGELG